MRFTSPIFTRGMSATALAAAAAVAAVAAVAAQRPLVTIHDDDITVRGCVREADASGGGPGSTLVWSRSDIMMAAATDGEALGSEGPTGRVFYWLDEDEDLARHVGQMVEVKGELEDFKKGEVDVDRDGDFTNIELTLDGKKEKARVPTSWLRSRDRDEDHDVDIVARKIEVKHIDMLGACDAR